MNNKTSTVKEHIINTASLLFYKQGYNNTGINQIIKEANVAKASLYSHFASKEALAATYLRNRREEWLSNVKEYVDKGTEIKEKIQRLFDILEQKNVNDDFRGCAFINIISEVKNEDQEIIDEVKAQKQTLLELIRTIFESENSILQKDKNIKSKAVLLLFEGAIVEAQIYKDPWPIKAARDAALTLV